MLRPVADLPSAPAVASARIVSAETFEKVALLALPCTIFASILPGIDATFAQVAAGVAAIVVANAAISLANALLGERRDFELDYGLFFAFLITTIIWLYDAFRPIYATRFGPSRCGRA